MLAAAMGANLTTLFLVALIAVAAPLVSELPIGLRLPIVVVEIALGIVVGPDALGWAQASGVLAFLGTLGLAFLFFLAGLELNFEELRGPPLQLGLKAWTVSIVLALTVTFLLRTTLVVSLILTHEHTTWEQTLLLLAFTGVALAAAIAALRVRLQPIVRLLQRTLHASSQLPVRICILLMVGLVVLAHEFGLDLILGAFAAGMVVRLASEGEKGEVLREKLEAIGYGFLVPLFFVVSGIKFNLGSLLESTDALLRTDPFKLDRLAAGRHRCRRAHNAASHLNLSQVGRMK